MERHLPLLKTWNRVVLWVTWLFLAIGLADHFLVAFLPYRLALMNLNLLWVLVILVFAGEGTAFFLERRAKRRGEDSDHGSR
jgi:hypothetical protein